MRVLFYGDLQIHTRKRDYASFLNATMLHLERLVKEQKPDLLVNLGDVLHTFGTIEAEDLLFAYRWTKRLEIAMEGRPHLIIKGNHDIADRYGKTAAIEVLASHQTRVVLEPERYGDFLVLPYTKEFDEVREWLDQQSAPAGIFGHVDWVGAHATPTHATTEGLYPHEIAKRWTNVPVFNGHYHTPAQLGPIHLVGSPLHMNFSDALSPIPRGFAMWDTSTGEVTRIENRNTYYCVEATLETIDDISAFYEKVYPNRQQLKLKIFTPLELVEQAQVTFGEGFLWATVTPTDSQRVTVEHLAGINLASSPDQIVQRVVETTPDDLDADLLEKYARKAFK